MPTNTFGFTNFRFLDCLDSIRFRKDITFSDIRQMHAKAELILCVMYGDGVIISENQLVDSIGFIELFPQLVRLGHRYNVNIPIKVALRDVSLGVYQSAAALFANIDQDDVKKRFQLSAFRELDESYKRRKIWAQAIANGERPAQEHVREYEQDTLLGLIDILKELVQRAEYGVAKSGNMPFILAENISQIAHLKNDDGRFNALFEEKQDPLYHQIELPEWLAESQREPAQEIVTVLHEFEAKFGKITRRSLIHNNVEEMTSNALLRHGLLEVADALYNFNLAISTGANNFSDSALRDLSNPYVATARALTNWAKETTEIGYGVANLSAMANPNGWMSVSQFDWTDRLSDEEKQRALNELPLEACVSLLQEKSWEDTLVEYKYQLANLSNIDSIMNGMQNASVAWQTRRDDAKKRLQDARHEHIRGCADYIATESVRLSPEGRLELNLDADKNPEISIEVGPPYFKFKTDLRSVVQWVHKPLKGVNSEQHKRRIQGLIGDLAEAYNPLQDD